MTTAEQVQAAYAWACEVRSQPKATASLLYCASQIRSAVENADNDEWEHASANIVEVVKDWKRYASDRRRRGDDISPGMAKAIKVVSYIMGLETSA